VETDSAADWTQRKISFRGTRGEVRSITMSIRAFAISRLEVISPAVAARQKHRGEPARSPPRERRNPPQEFAALGDHEKLSYLRARDQAVTEFACFTRVGPWKNASAVSTEIRPAPKISTIRETMRKAKGAAAINLSGSEKKESSASRSPIT
jgi:hypothetical protein